MDGSEVLNMLDKISAYCSRHYNCCDCKLFIGGYAGKVECIFDGGPDIWIPDKSREAIVPIFESILSGSWVDDEEAW